MPYGRRRYSSYRSGNRSGYSSGGGTCRTCGRYQRNLSAHLRKYPNHKKR